MAALFGVGSPNLWTKDHLVCLGQAVREKGYGQLKAKSLGSQLVQRPTLGFSSGHDLSVMKPSPMLGRTFF